MRFLRPLLGRKAFGLSNESWQPQYTKSEQRVLKRKMASELAREPKLMKISRLTFETASGKKGYGTT